MISMRPTVSLAVLLLASAACGDSGSDGTGGSAAATTSSSSSGDTTSAGGGGQGGSTSDGGGGAAAAPEVTDLAPAVAKVTTEITLTGTGFGAEQGDSFVRVGGIITAPTSWSDTQIQLDIPYELKPGGYDVVVNTTRGVSGLPLEVVLPRTVYLNRETSPNSVAALAMDEDGALTPVAGSPFPAGPSDSSYGGDVGSIALHRQSRRLFAANYGSISVFDIHGVTGALTQVPGSPFEVCTARVFGVAAASDGGAVYAGCLETGGVVAMVVDPATGALSHAPGSPAAFPAAVRPFLFHGGTFLGVANEQGAVGVFAVGADRGLTAVADSPFATASNYLWGADENRFYVTGAGLEVYDVDATTGALTAVTGSPFAQVTGGGPIALDPGGTLLAIQGNGLETYTISSTGVPTAASDTPPPLSVSGSMTFTRDGAFLLAQDEGGDEIQVFAVASDGTLTEVLGSPFSKGAPDDDASGIVVSE